VETVVFGDFEWDEEKARENLAKHGVSFEEAASVFLDLDFVLTDDPTEAGRFIALGFSSQARMLFVVHVERAVRVRIISARRATRTEARTYERRKETPE
jgi:uncharacterized DUF497 family protein